MCVIAAMSAMTRTLVLHPLLITDGRIDVEQVTVALYMIAPIIPMRRVLLFATIEQTVDKAARSFQSDPSNQKLPEMTLSKYEL